MDMDQVAGSCQHSVKQNRHLYAVFGSQQDMLTGNLPFFNLQFVKLSESIGSESTTNFRFCKLFKLASNVKHVNFCDEMTEEFLSPTISHPQLGSAMKPDIIC